MKNTRFMEVLFSATENMDSELTSQVAQDIERAKNFGKVEDDEVKYEDAGDGKVAITDKENGEVTMAEQAEDGNYDLYPIDLSEQIEGFIHPEGDGVTPGQQQGAPDEDVESHMDGQSVYITNTEDGGLNPEAGHERSVEELAEAGPEACCPECGEEPCDKEEKEFSVSTDNNVVLRIFSDQEFCERLFSEVIESEETAKVGDLKVEKDADQENTVIVTDETTGDQAKIVLNNDDMEVTELDSKNFSEEEQYEQLHVVGVDPENHVIVDAPEYTEDSANELVERLAEQGVDACQVFDNPEDARDYAIQLYQGLDGEDAEEPEQAEFSDHTIFLTKFYSRNTVYMDRLFSEACNDVDASQSDIEDAIESGDQIERDGEIITPVDAKTAVVEDKENDEFTKITLDGDDMNCDAISAEEAKELTDHLVAGDERDYSDYEDEDVRYFSDYEDQIYTNDEETKFFSESEYLTNYMVRLFSGDADEKEIEDAIESGEEIEKDGEIITPVDAKTAVVEDKESGEFTKAVLSDDDIDVTPISEDEAKELTYSIAVEDTDYDYDQRIYCDNSETRFFSENEYMTEYMVRLFSGDADESAIEDAIENGDQIEKEGEVITPIDSKTAIVEDKENGEFTKAVMDDEKLDLQPISEEEADKLTDGLEVEDTEKDEDKPEEEKEEKNYSYYEDPILDKFFADAVGVPAPAADPNAQQEIIPAVMDPATGQLVPADQAQAGADPNAADPNAAGGVAGADPNAPQMSVEAIEDKAIAAVQQIQAAAAEAEATIMNAKAAPAGAAEPDLQEAQFSRRLENDLATEKTFSENDTLVSWLSGNKLGK